MISSYSMKVIPSYNYIQKIIPIEPISLINYNQNSNQLYFHKRNQTSLFLPTQTNVIIPNTNPNHTFILSNSPLALKSEQVITTSYKKPSVFRIEKQSFRRQQIPSQSIINKNIIR